MPEPRRWTVLELIRAATEVFARRGLPSPRLDADLLLSHVLGWPRIDLYARYDMPVDDGARGSYRELVSRRSRGEPVAYILGRRGFFDLDFEVDASVLIPRGDTECVVQAALDRLPVDDVPRLVIDVGVGSGCILVSILKRRPSVLGVGIDVSMEALRVARRNADRHLAGASCLLVRSTLLDAARPQGGRRAALIVSNPPYVTREEAAALASDVRDFEPSLALYSPADGLHFHRRLLEEAPRVLADDGAMVLELPGFGGGELTDLWMSFRPQGSSTIGRDLGDRERAFTAVMTKELTN